MIQIDMPMPANCLDCPACNEYLMCAIPINGRKWGENDVREFSQSRPEWCPLKEQKEQRKAEVVYKPRNGWNDAECSNCGQHLDKAYSYCPKCKKELDWNNNQT